MNKIAIGAQPLIYPMPALLIGANVNGKPNFMTAAWSGIANSEPPMLSVAIRRNRYTFTGVRQSMAFSVNVPSCELVKETDYCGIVSGSETDKVETCKFKVFYGKLEGVPLIEQCPVNMECRVVHILELGSHSLVIGKIEETYVSESCLTDGNPDVAKINPLIFARRPAFNYHSLGQVVARAFSVGRDLIPGGKDQGTAQ